MVMALYGIDQESTVRVTRDHRMSSQEFFEFCAANPDWRIEQESDREIIIMPRAGGETGHRNFDLTVAFGNWAQRDGRGRASIRTPVSNCPTVRRARRMSRG
jgi:Uma2 family endonuclease